MKKKLFLMTALCLLLGLVTLSADVVHADDPPVWDKCTSTPTTPCP